MHPVKFGCFHVFKSFNFQHDLNLGGGESHVVPRLESTGVDARVKCGVWLTIAAKVGPNAPVHERVISFIVHVLYKRVCMTVS
jgi:hypothetical protein